MMMSLLRKDLAYAYQILAYLGLDDHTYTHLSVRAEDGCSYYIYPFGFRFEEVTPECLLRVSFDGEILEGSEYQYNRTGYIVHGAIYQRRQDINAIFHIHTPEIVAVSALKEGLQPLSQWALHFYHQIAYHSYNSLALDESQGNDLIDDLQDKFILLMRNHGSLTCGKTIQEAMFYTYHLQQACKTQCLILSMNQELIVPDISICEKAVKELLSFESDLGARDWEAWVRRLKISHP
ncbi:MAG: class II aldolase/adducin family protein [Holosporales bacterium]|mgnify:CR=1 FL=1|nr:class II aldolase/adducin family protein [Holosporales bacterium]